MADPKVGLYLANDREDLTPAEARRVAAALLEAARRAEAAKSHGPLSERLRRVGRGTEAHR